MQTQDLIGAGTDAAVVAVMQDTALSTYSAVESVVSEGVEKITITSTNKSAATTASELSVNTQQATALFQARDAAAAANAAATDTAAIDGIFNALNAQSGLSATADTDLAKQVAPQTDTISGSAIATRAMTGTVQGIVSNRMASLRSGDAYVTGMSAGNGMSANSGFIQAFGSEAEQKNTGPTTAKVYGYDSSTSGVAIGFDGMTEMDQLLVYLLHSLQLMLMVKELVNRKTLSIVTQFQFTLTKQLKMVTSKVV